MGKIAILDVASKLIVQNGLSKKEATRFANKMFDLIREALEEEKTVKVKGLGTFKIIDVDSRESVNVNTGERVLIEGHNKITFTPDALMKELVNKPFSQFETIVLNDGVDFKDPSEEELERLVKLLQDNPNITIELSAHTDMKGTDEFNNELSQKRAQSCCDYLLKRGIEQERLTSVGYGKTKPVICDKALNKQYPWIAVEQELDEAYILGLPEDKQEICNQINRRTEFKVVKTTYKLY